jgi:hypothetical protein
MMTSESIHVEESILVTTNALLDGEALVKKIVKACSVHVRGELGRMTYKLNNYDHTYSSLIKKSLLIETYSNW